MVRITVDVDVYFCVNAHNDDDDVEGVEEIDVDHLEVGRLGNHLANAGLHCGHDQQAGDANHDSVLVASNRLPSHRLFKE